MTVTEQLLESLVTIVASQSPVTGRLIDQIGLPVEGATVRAVATGDWSGTELAQGTTNAEGAFELRGITSPTYQLVVSAYGIQRRLNGPGSDTQRGEIKLVLPLRLTASVGDNADNRPHDLRRLQDRLHRLGRLTDANVADEPIDLTLAPPVTPGPRLMAALATQIVASFGRPPSVSRVEPASPSARVLAENPPFPPCTIELTAPVGLLPGDNSSATLNEPADVALVQDRLRQLGLLSPADHVNEAVELTAAGPVDVTGLPQTLAAIALFDRKLAGGSLRAIVPGAVNARLLADPRYIGRRPMRLTGSIGTNGRNHWADVLAVQVQLHRLGFLSDADLAVERVMPSATGEVVGSVADADIPHTITALRQLRETRLGEPTPAVGFIDPVDSAMHILNRPRRLELSDMVGWQPPMANLPADVRQVQERLRLLGLLSEADFDDEKVDPDSRGPVDRAMVTQTEQALALAAAQRAPLSLADAVGPGYQNYPGDVRAVQDRLRGLGFLATADHDRERVDPEGELVDDAELTSTFAAIQACRERVFALPPAADAQPWSAQPRILPGDETQRFLSDPLFYGRDTLQLRASVGSRGWNFPGDVRAVQERLWALQLLPGAAFAKERIDPLRITRVGDEEIPFTREVIHRLRTAVLGEPIPVVERLDMRSTALLALEDRLGALRESTELEGTIGVGGDNRPTDVLAIQQRLHGLGLLADEGFEIESQAVPAGPSGSLLDSQLAETIKAIDAWQQLTLGAQPEHIIGPFSESLRTLNWPPLVRRIRLSLGGSVGRGGANTAADVRAVQDRLHELGLLESTAYFSERVDPAAPVAIVDDALGYTIAAIEVFQASVFAAAPVDGLVRPSSPSQRFLADPAFSTPAAANPNRSLTSAGPTLPTFADTDLNRTILAIEEAVRQRSGDHLARLWNAAMTPAEWGVTRVRVAAAIELLASPECASFAEYYNLGSDKLAALAIRANAVEVLFDNVCDAVASNTTEAELASQIEVYVGSHSATVRQDTGLGPEDVERLFRAGQLRRHLADLEPSDDPATLFEAATHPHAAANLSILGLTPNDADAYLRDTGLHDKQRAGFVARALFHAHEGQTLRNALTDDSGFKFGRHVILARWEATMGFGLTSRQRAQITAWLQYHLSEVADLVGDLTVIAADTYVQRVMDSYDENP